VNWEAIGAIAELVGATGVIIFLVYLAKQINANSDNVSQNTKVLLSNTDVASNQITNELYGWQINSSEVAELTLKGNASFQSLDSIEKYQYAMVL